VKNLSAGQAKQQLQQNGRPHGLIFCHKPNRRFSTDKIASYFYRLILAPGLFITREIQ